MTRRLLLAAVLLHLACSASQPPNVVLIVLDTARADRFSLYGHERDTSPRLTQFAADAITFERARATSSWTLASHASLFTGLLPMTHGATQEHLRLDDSLETLAELLQRRGYATVAFSNNSWVSGATSLTRGFEEVFPQWKQAPALGDEHPTNAAALQWLRRRDPERPFLLFVNYIEPHWPYAAPKAYQDRFVAGDVPEGFRKRSSFTAVQWYLGRGRENPVLLATRERMYEAEIAYVDAVLGELLDQISALGLLDESLVVVTSDHGENLGEHGHQGHSFALYEPTLRIPLVIRPPGGVPGGARRSDPVQLTDVFATLAHAAGAKPRDERVVGHDLLAGPVPPRRAVVAEYYEPEMFLRRFPDTAAAAQAVAPYRRRLRSIQVGSHKLIWGSDGSRRLYDLSDDPGESTDRKEQDPERASDLEAELDGLVRTLAREAETGDVMDLDPATQENLRALGYLP